MKIEIFDIKSDNIIAEYTLNQLKEIQTKTFDEAWEIAIDDDLVEESNRSNCIIRFAVAEEKLEDFTNPPNQHPLPNF